MDKTKEYYLREIEKAKSLSKEEEAELVKTISIKGANCEEMKTLKHSSLKAIYDVASQHLDRGLTLENLIELGYEGLEVALSKYNLNSDYSFSAYAVWWIRQRMLQELNEHE